MKQLVVCSLGCLAYSCQGSGNKHADNQAAATILTATSEKSLTDSLYKYMHLSEFVSRGDSARYVLYGENLGTDKIGVVAITDSVLLFFQSIHSTTQLTGRFTFADYASDFKKDDLNGDNKDDFIVYGNANMHGQKLPYVFISDSAGVMHYRPNLSLHNISYDWNKKELHSFYFGGAFSVHSKRIYHWRGDSIEQTAGLEYNMGNGEIEVYRMRNGKRFQRKLYHNHNEAVFDTALFKIDDY
ncbi:MAG TPA: hypothetical protein VFO93_06330 [Hymenobacter sp.]|uniref:hypothetical protein n=1 Tax=Hymenobacter sp. TaxID=1898978 RepID=UPI002D80DD2F|nr:hypothetical protein [Hymenobacter sp.]HET9503137.1 hypothetical protein [Hymenobacter sp.]